MNNQCRLLFLTEGVKVRTKLSELTVIMILNEANTLVDHSSTKKLHASMETNLTASGCDESVIHWRDRARSFEKCID